MIATTYSLAEVATEMRMTEWALAELVRSRRVPCLRVGTPPEPGQKDRRPIRFTDEHVARIVAEMTVEGDATPVLRRRKRRA